jgi:hypothetical protein
LTPQGLLSSFQECPRFGLLCRAVPAMNGPAMPKPERTRNLSNWALLVVLAALAAALYLAIALKIAKLGF